LKKSYLHTPQPLAVFISAEQKENLDELRDTVLNLVKSKHIQIFPNWLNTDESYTENTESWAE
jgi:GTP-binding protein HflX